MTHTDSMVPWHQRRIAVVGGDARDPEIARLAAETGADVRAFGLPWPDGGVPGVRLEPSARAAAEGADYLFLPIPMGVGLARLRRHTLPSRSWRTRCFLGLAPGAHVFVGRATPELREAAGAAGVETHEYDPDRELMLLRGPAIVEGAIQLAIEHTDVTIHGAEVVVVGYGTIGSLLARTLRALGARLHVAARNPIQRAAAYADGAEPHNLEELPNLAPSLQMVFSTVPARVVGREVLERLPSGSLVLDIAPPPDHADLDLAAELGHRAVWARGLGRRAPITVGRSQWMGLRRLHRGDRGGPEQGTRSRSADDRALAIARRGGDRRGFGRADGRARAGSSGVPAGRARARRGSPVGLLCGQRRVTLAGTQHAARHGERSERGAPAHAAPRQSLLDAASAGPRHVARAVHARGAGRASPDGHAR